MCLLGHGELVLEFFHGVKVVFAKRGTQHHMSLLANYARAVTAFVDQLSAAAAVVDRDGFGQDVFFFSDDVCGHLCSLTFTT